MDEDAVFRAPPKEFTAARDAWAATVKAAGRSDEAKQVKGWRRPTVVVWLWNRLILDGDAAAREAVELAAQLAEAMGKENLTQKVAALRGAGSAVVREGRQLAERLSVGLSTAQERELAELVQALPWSEEVRERAARGRLHEAPPPVDPMEAMRVLAGAPPAPIEAIEKDPEPDEGAQLEAEAQAARAAVVEAEAAHERAQLAAERARAQVARAEKQLDEARRAADEAEREESERARVVGEAKERRDAAEAALSS